MTDRPVVRLSVQGGGGVAGSALNKKNDDATMRSEVDDEFAAEIPRVYRFALRLTNNNAHLAEDITQETFIRAWKHRRRLRRDASRHIWMFRIAHNLWRDHVRREARRRGRESDAARPVEPTFPASDSITSDHEEVRRALDAMAALPPRQREVLHLVACEELSHAEVARILDVSTDAVKASLSLARRQMREWCDRPDTHSTR